MAKKENVMAKKIVPVYIRGRLSHYDEVVEDQEGESEPEQEEKPVETIQDLLIFQLQKKS